jgi:hypothetical protein
MQKVRIWTPESDTDSRTVECLANKIIHFFGSDILIQTSSKNAYNRAASKANGLENAVNIYLKQDDFVIFLLDFDGTQSHAERIKQPNSHINKITEVTNKIPDKTKLLYMCQELEAWLLVDCLGICCFIKQDKNAIIRQDNEWIKFANKYQKGETDSIVEVEQGGNNAKEYLIKFSRKIIEKINPKLKQKDIDKKEYVENIADLVAEFIDINQETLNRNKSLNEFADLLYTIASEKLTLYDLEKSFNLTLRDHSDFFPEWKITHLIISENQKDQLDSIKTNCLHLSKRLMLEETVKNVVLLPLLSIAELDQPPFYSIAKKSVKVSVKDEKLTIRGKIDVLVMQDRFWILVIESKQAGVSLQKGIPQALTYMLADPNRQKDVYGMVTNGSNFIFLKLSWRDKPIYGISDEYTLMRHENDLYAILQILKTIGTAII